MPGVSRSTRTGRRTGRPDTRSEILRAARGLFAERGFRGTSIRGVAAAAAVDPALVHHYYGTKEGLFRAALEMPLDPEALIGEIVDGDPEEAPWRLVETFLRVWDSAETGPAMVGFLRRVLADQEATDLVRDFIGAVLLRTAADRLLGDVAPAEAEVRIGLVVSQMLGLVVVRKVLVVEPIASMPPSELTAAVAPTIARYLRGDDLELAVFGPDRPPHVSA